MSKHNKAVNSPMGQPISPQRQNPIYPKPTVPVALGEFLSPKQVTAAGLEVVVTYPSIKKGDVIALTFNDVDTFVPIVVGNQTSVSFWVSVPHIVKAFRTTVDIHYTLSGQSGGERSDIFHLTVLPFMEGDLKMAKITEASPPTPGVLDLATFTGDAEVKVAPWPMIEAGQTVWLDLEYEGQAGAIPIIAGEKVTTDEVGTGMTRSILRTDLEKAPHDKLINLPLKVNFSDAAIIPFPTLELVVRQKGQGGVELIQKFDSFPPGRRPSPFTTPTLNLSLSGGTMEIRDYDGKRALAIYFSPSPNLFTIPLPANCFKVTLSLNAPYNVSISCKYGENESEDRIVASVDYEETTFSYEDIRTITLSHPDQTGVGCFLGYISFTTTTNRGSDFLNPGAD